MSTNEQNAAASDAPYSTVADECKDRCLVGECNAPGTFQGCGGCCGCLGPCVVTYEKSEQSKASEVPDAGDQS